ncbi:hypothetical protein L6R52_15265, partial [Myxococcota bacterium]|nr:hypothetical protein [Myxococcota bacterium]
SATGVIDADAGGRVGGDAPSPSSDAGRAADAGRSRVSETLRDGADAGAKRPRKKRPELDPDAPPVDVAVFRARDDFVTARLAKRGLGWRDLALAEPDHAKEWALWRIGAERPSAEALRWVEAELVRAIDGIRIDARLLEQKLDRVRASLNAVPEAARDDRYRALMERYQDAAHSLGRKRDLGALAALLTGLEADAASFASRAQ